MSSALPSTIAARVEHEVVIKKSRFIATLVAIAISMAALLASEFMARLVGRRIEVE